MKNAVWGLLLLVLTGCNVFAPFNSDSSQEDYLEDALKCLDNGDFACAIAAYNKLPDGPLKDQKLCTGYLAKTGVTLDVLLNLVQEQSASMLGDVAQALMPWNSTRGSDAESAANNCAAFYADNPQDNTGILLATMGYIVDCTVRIGKTDLYQCSADAVADPDVAGPNAGHLVQTDVQGSGSEGMCKADVNICSVDDIGKIPAGDLGQAGLTSIASAFSLIPTDLATGSVVTDTVRAEIATTLPTH